MVGLGMGIYYSLKGIFLVCIKPLNEKRINIQSPSPSTNGPQSLEMPVR